jgi:L-amino acid N-acyltransferase YncA
MLDKLPRQITLRDGLNLTLRPVTPGDASGLYSFFMSLPEEDRRYLRHDVADRRLMEKWAGNLNDDQVLALVVEEDGPIVAQAILNFQSSGWGRHVAEIHLTLTPEFQRRGLAEALLQEISRLLAGSDVKKVLARLVTSQEGVIAAFEKAGFKKLSVLTNYVKDLRQQYADIALMVNELQPQAG